jgi:monovalent cation/hydrogen antiporter
MLALSTLGSLVAGYGLARLFHLVFARVRDPASGTILQFVSTFGVWILAERIGLSAIITMVVYAMTLARAAPRRVAARNRISSYSVWETAVFVLNVLAFVLMGLQVRPILSRLSDESRLEALVLAAAVLATVILVRLAWVLVGGPMIRSVSRRPRVPADGQDVRGDLLIGWYKPLFRGPRVDCAGTASASGALGHGRGGIEMWLASIVLVTAIGFNILDSVIQDEE